MLYLHTMVRVTDVAQSLRFYCDGLGFKEVRRSENEKGRYTLIFLSASGKDDGALIELTYNWDPEVYTGGEISGASPLPSNTGAITDPTPAMGVSMELHTPSVRILAISRVIEALAIPAGILSLNCTEAMYWSLKSLSA